MRPARLEISLSALRHNYHWLASKAPTAKTIAVVKANAYGHGIVEVARALDEAPMYGVAFVTEAKVLRDHGIEKPILVLQGAREEREARLAAQLGLTLVVHRPDQAEDLLAFRNDVVCWMKLDAGMGRLGFRQERIAHFVDRLGSRCVAMMAHFSKADGSSLVESEAQLSRFEAFTECWGGERSMANSAALLALPAAHFDYVRPGIAMYGSNPFSELARKPSGLRAVMRFTAPMVAINGHKKGDEIGYSGLSSCDEDMLVGVVAAGYADGYPRLAQPGTPVAVNGVRTRTLGRISMDMLCVDLRPCSGARVGDEVELWGDLVDVDEVAASAGTLGYELLCQAGAAGRFG